MAVQVVDDTGRLAVQPDGVDAVAVEVSDKWLVPEVTELVIGLGFAEPEIVAA